MLGEVAGNDQIAPQEFWIPFFFKHEWAHILCGKGSDYLLWEAGWIFPSLSMWTWKRNKARKAPNSQQMFWNGDVKLWAWHRAWLTTCDSELGLADVLIYDITDAELLLLLLPHQLHTLVNKNVLFLGEKTQINGHFFIFKKNDRKPNHNLHSSMSPTSDPHNAQGVMSSPK